MRRSTRSSSIPRGCASSRRPGWLSRLCVAQAAAHRPDRQPAVLHAVRRMGRLSHAATMESAAARFIRDAERWRAVAVSSSCLQFTTRTRDPALADLTLNTLSAALGAALALSARASAYVPCCLSFARTDRMRWRCCSWCIWLALHAAPFMPTASFIWYLRAPSMLVDWQWTAAGHRRVLRRLGDARPSRCAVCSSPRVSGRCLPSSPPAPCWRAW